MNKKLLFSLTVLMLAVLACSTVSIGTNQVVGSGKVISETRSVSGFDSVALEGSGAVNITFGTDESVVVKADDNIVPLIETNVQNGTLVIGIKGNTGINTSNGILVTVTMKSLKSLSLKGSGSIDATGLVGNDVEIRLAGSGNINVTGTADSVNISLPGSGNIYCDGLQARSATVTLDGSGTITTYASESLDAGIRGSGSIRFKGNPSHVSKNVTGSGSITP